jgi:hypothetical protein
VTVQEQLMGEVTAVQAYVEHVSEEILGRYHGTNPA